MNLCHKRSQVLLERGRECRKCKGRFTADTGQEILGGDDFVLGARSLSLSVWISGTFSFTGEVD